MYAQVEKTKENTRKAVSNSVAKKKGGVNQGFGFVDNHYKSLTKMKLQESKKIKRTFPIDVGSQNKKDKEKNHARSVSNIVQRAGPTDHDKDLVKMTTINTLKDWASSYSPSIAAVLNNLFSGSTNAFLTYATGAFALIMEGLDLTEATNLYRSKNMSLSTYKAYIALAFFHAVISCFLVFEGSAQEAKIGLTKGAAGVAMNVLLGLGQILLTYGMKQLLNQAKKDRELGVLGNR